jgi:hypothetical protein
MNPTQSHKINALEESAKRIVAIVIAVLSTVFSLVILGSCFQEGGYWQGILIGSCPATMAILCWGFALRGHIAESRRRITSALEGGVMLGGIGFAAGFFGPMILSKSNLGPLLGIFTTGPLGFVLGAILGRIRASKQKPS